MKKTGLLCLALSMLLALGGISGCAGQKESDGTAAGVGNGKETVAGSESSKETVSGEEASAGAGDSAGAGASSGSETQEVKDFTSFTADTLSGESVTQDIFADYDLTMVNIWGTFCGPCINEMPELGEIQAEYQDKSFQIVGIVIDVFNRDGSVSEEQLDLAREIVDTTGASYTHLIPSMELIVAKLQDVTAIPETIFVDKEGNFVGKSYLGARSKEQWIEIIDSMLEELQN